MPSLPYHLLTIECECIRFTRIAPLLRDTVLKQINRLGRPLGISFVFEYNVNMGSRLGALWIPCVPHCMFKAEMSEPAYLHELADRQVYADLTMNRCLQTRLSAPAGFEPLPKGNIADSAPEFA